MATAIDDTEGTHPPPARESARLATLQAVHALLDKATVVEDGVSQAFVLLGERHGLHPCILWLLDEGARQLRVAVGVGLSGRGHQQGRYLLGEGVTGRVVVSGRPAVVPQVSDEPLYLNRTGAVTPEGESRAFICVPVILGGRAVGALGALTRPRENPDLQQTCDFLSVVAGLFAPSLRRRPAKGAPDDDEVMRARPVRLPQRADLGSLVGSSDATLSMLEQALQVAPTRTTVLVRGESGTGKELVAELIIATLRGRKGR